MNEQELKNYKESVAAYNADQRQRRERFIENGHLTRLHELEAKYADFFEYQKLKAMWERMQDAK